MTDQYTTSPHSAKTLAEWYAQASSGSELAYTVEMLLCLAEGLGYSADSPEFLGLQELKLPMLAFMTCANRSVSESRAAGFVE